MDVWKEFLNKYVDAKSLTRLCQTSSAFKELVEGICRTNVRIAWECRKEDQIPLARKFILACANNGNPEAMFHLGFALTHEGGWGYPSNGRDGMKWLKAGAKLGNISALACYYGYKTSMLQYWDDYDQIKHKIMSSSDSFAKGYWCLCCSKEIDVSAKAAPYFRISAERDNNEYGMYYLAYAIDLGAAIKTKSVGGNLPLYKESAMMGFATAQKRYSEMLSMSHNIHLVSERDYFLRRATRQTFWRK
jgi:TPR repeat protein